jgi:hypothetical protein
MPERYMVSRSHELPQSIQDWAKAHYFNAWRQKLWPFRELELGSILLWYEGKKKTLTWETRVVQVDQFEYLSMRELGTRLNHGFGGFEPDQDYLKGKPEAGFCVAYRCEPTRYLGAPAPDEFQMPQLGWRRVDATLVAEWQGVL